ncbi:phosphoribosylformylglycinamidine cyclo-ligase [Aliifodinibius salipaludis]|uniref:Phosphoribosylformylglycinamidine cyclo-ligase n=1 Tax=Fodinibius salipaludis TaxID=2032627 RepID=A0A2A2G5Y3_9BACT|nr:phosphoribosylformylglycinamidine cyclo-ligase [Aliifodinibius salipaludis]PAU92708.1 phosphoribosylformylglycinamidine cyclo-ligase [Aliifodinibius salipaludis]
MSKKKFTYKDAGVDIEAGEEMVESIKGLVKETHSDAVLHNIGGFGGFFRPDLSSYNDPVFVSSVDGVGTKLIVAFKSGKYDTVGQDLVNHCINDIAVCGADPLFFLDYFSTGKLEKDVGYQVVKGFSKACKENGVALIGGETAEMPDIYSEGEFDLAGNIVGMVDRKKVIDGSDIEKGNILLGFPSTGLHTNGYSLARKVLFSEYEVTDHVDELGTTVGEAMLAVHKSYLPIIRKLRNLNSVNGFSHITGGGIMGNTKRVVPEKLTIKLDWNAWQRPPIFELIQDLGNVPEDDMRATFNLGIGLIAIVDPNTAGKVKEISAEMDEEIIEMGVVD